jgi:nucleoside-diphosphate-sugar epimerase
MKILLVGGTSSLGRALKPVFSEFSEVITAGRKNCDINLDLNDPIEKISLPNNMDAVIHTAAHFGGKTAKEILEAESVNVLGTLKVCQAAVQAKTNLFILISSIFSCLNRNSAHYSIYALSKKHSEELAEFYCSTHSMPLTILRPSQLYGNEENFRVHQPFFYTIIDKAEKGEDITLYGSNDALRNYMYIDDMVNIIVKVVQNKVEGTYSCVHPTDISYSHIAKAAFSAFNRTGKVSFLKERTDIPDNIFEKDDSLYKKIGFYPQVSIEEGMRRIALFRRTS